MRQFQHAQALSSSVIYLLMNLSLLQPYIEVDTIYGRLRGAKTLARNGRPYIEFLNIPYAKPPVKKLRFEVKIASLQFPHMQIRLRFNLKFLIENFLFSPRNSHFHGLGSKMPQIMGTVASNTNF